MYNRLLAELYDEMGIIKPKALADLMIRLKELGKIESKIGKFPISKYDYTGDLLERFQTIHYDKDTGLYSADFAELTDATREMLQKMKLYRVSDTDVAEITKAILERMKIPIQPSAPAVTTGGFIEEEIIAEGLIDLGEVVEENIENALELNKPNKKNYRKKTMQNKHAKRNASRKHSQKRK